MAEQSEHEVAFLEHLDWIDRVGASICRRNGLNADDSSEFVSTARLRIVENDYAVLRKFRGDSSMRTYLAVVIASFFRDYRVSTWGRWRPSADAKRVGRVAVRLETLIMRDHLSLVEAGQALRSAGETTLTDRKLGEILLRLPRRVNRPVEVGFEGLETIHGLTTAGDQIETEEIDATRRTAIQVLNRAIERLPDEDQVILRLRYWEGFGVAEIARTLGLAQKPLYRRLDRTATTLRQYLVADGVSDVVVQEILSWPT